MSPWAALNIKQGREQPVIWMEPEGTLADQTMFLAGVTTVVVRVKDTIMHH